MQPWKTYLAKKDQNSLKLTIQDLSSFLNEFTMIHKVKSTMRLCIVEDPVQNIESEYSDIFQFYFYNPLFGPNNDTKTLNHVNPSKPLFRHCAIDIVQSDIA